MSKLYKVGIVFLCITITILICAFIFLFYVMAKSGKTGGEGVTVIARQKLKGGVIFHRAVILGPRTVTTPEGMSETVWVLRHVQGHPGTPIDVRTHYFPTYEAAQTFAIAGQSWYVDKHGKTDKTLEDFTRISDAYVEANPEYNVLTNNCITYSDAMFAQLTGQSNAALLAVFPGSAAQIMIPPEFFTWAKENNYTVPESWQASGTATENELLTWAQENGITDPSTIIGFPIS